VNADTIQRLNGKPSRSVHELVRQSLLYLEWQAEHEEILKHKWIESEKVGRDVGLNYAKLDWGMRHRSNWRRWWRRQNFPQLVGNEFQGAGI
jgi:hypothetical protein